MHIAKSTTVSLIAAACLVAVGSLVFVAPAQAQTGADEAKPALQIVSGIVKSVNDTVLVVVQNKQDITVTILPSTTINKYTNQVGTPATVSDLKVGALVSLNCTTDDKGNKLAKTIAILN